jgi:transcriptional regulator with XRE-family HTH domain
MESIEAVIGRTFQNARESQGITISEAAEDTKIKSETLREMEQGDFSGIPAPVYIRGFIRSYADYLGLDAADMVRKYASHRREAVPFSLPRKRFKNSAPAEGAAQEAHSPGVLRSVLKKRTPVASSGDRKGAGEQKRPQAGARAPRRREASSGVPASVWLAGTAMMFLVVGVLTIMAIFALPRNAPEVQAREYTKGELASHAERAAVVDVSPRINPFHRPSPESPHKVSLMLSDRSWLSVRVEGQLVEEGFFDGGFEREWSGHRIQVRLGHPRNAVVRVDGKVCDMGEDRLPVVMTVTSENGNRQDVTSIQ